MKTYLDEREYDILFLYFGFSGIEYDLRDIGEKIGLTAERTRQIKEKALGKLKRKLNQNNTL